MAGFVRLPCIRSVQASGSCVAARVENHDGNVFGRQKAAEESRKLVVGDRVSLNGNATNQGTVKGKSWSGVTIDWDEGDYFGQSQRHGAGQSYEGPERRNAGSGPRHLGLTPGL